MNTNVIERPILNPIYKAAERKISSLRPDALIPTPQAINKEAQIAIELNAQKLAQTAPKNIRAEYFSPFSTIEMPTGSRLNFEI